MLSKYISYSVFLLFFLLLTVSKTYLILKKIYNKLVFYNIIKITVYDKVYYN